MHGETGSEEVYEDPERDMGYSILPDYRYCEV
jgi:hypothetical protein